MTIWETVLYFIVFGVGCRLGELWHGTRLDAFLYGMLFLAVAAASYNLILAVRKR